MQTYADMNRIICRHCGAAFTTDIEVHKKHEADCRDRQRLERIATAVLAGMHASGDIESYGVPVESAASQARALIAELDKEPRDV